MLRGSRCAAHPGPDVPLVDVTQVCRDPLDPLAAVRLDVAAQPLPHVGELPHDDRDTGVDLDSLAGLTGAGPESDRARERVLLADPPAHGLLVHPGEGRDLDGRHELAASGLLGRDRRQGFRAATEVPVLVLLGDLDRLVYLLDRVERLVRDPCNRARQGEHRVVLFGHRRARQGVLQGVRRERRPVADLADGEVLACLVEVPVEIRNSLGPVCASVHGGLLPIVGDQYLSRVYSERQAYASAAAKMLSANAIASVLFRSTRTYSSALPPVAVITTPVTFSTYLPSALSIVAVSISRRTAIVLASRSTMSSVVPAHFRRGERSSSHLGMLGMVRPASAAIAASASLPSGTVMGIELGTLS